MTPDHQDHGIDAGYATVLSKALFIKQVTIGRVLPLLGSIRVELGTAREPAESIGHSIELNTRVWLAFQRNADEADAKGGIW
jgi:hypothetical protein